MFRIAICDDDLLLRETLYKMIKETESMVPEKIIVEVYNDGKELYEALQNQVLFDLIFMDIQMQEMNGLSLSERIRNEFENDLIEICFISTEKGFALELFEFRPLQFLIKPLRLEKVSEVIKKALKIRNKGEGTFEFKTGPTIHRLPIRDIVYFEGKGRKLLLHSKRNIYEFYSKISDVKEKLKYHDFFQIHKSFLVNYEQVKSLSYEELELYDGTVLSISQNFRTTVRSRQLGRDKK